MSDHDDDFLDEDLGDEEYDLGNDEEEALLADDNDFERLPEQQTISKGEEETDDILDLGVTDALEDLEAEEDHIQSKNKEKQKNYEKDEGEIRKRSSSAPKREPNKQSFHQESQEHHSEEELEVPVVRPKTDLREKLREKANSKQEAFNRNNQGIEDDDYEESKERRNRFQSERTVPTKMNHSIPDSLENVVTSDQQKPHYKNRDRGERNDRGDRNERNDRERGDRGDRGDRRNVRGRNGGRYESHQPVRYHHGHSALPMDQQPPYRAPPLENRPPFQPGLPSNVPLQPHPFQHPNSQPPYHHPHPNGPLSAGHPPHFAESRLSMMPNQFPDPLRPPGPRLNAPRMDFGNSRGPLPGPLGPPGIPGHSQPGPPIGLPGVSGLPGGPVYNCPPNQPPFGPNQSIYPGPGMHVSERVVPPHPAGNQGPPISIVPGPGQQGPMISVNSQGMPMQSFNAPQPPNQPGPPPAPPVYESRMPYSEPPFEAHLPFDSRGSYNNPPVSQFNNAPPMALPLTQNASQPIVVNMPNQVPGVPNIPNVSSLPAGHKILINPHFKGNQIKNDGKADPAEKFVQALKNASGSRDGRSNQPKSDDPFSYFSDVWQESKSQRPPNSNTRRSYSPESNYKSSNYNNYENKYKSESQWSHRDSHLEDHKSSRDKYRERESPPTRSRSDRRSASPDYRSENHDHGAVKTNLHKMEKSRSNTTSIKDSNRLAPKRSSDGLPDRGRKESSPKRPRPSTRHHHAEKTAEKIENKEKQEEPEGEGEQEGEEEEMDPEMREYHKKMEEQKRLREKILREKENRRKLAAMEKQNAASTDTISIENVKQESTLAAIAKESTKGKMNIAVARGRTKLVNVQSTEEKPASVRVVRAVPSKQSKDNLLKLLVEEEDDGGKSDLMTRIILNKAKNAQKTSVQKSNVQNSQKTSVSQAAKVNRQMGQIRQLLTNSQRVVVQGGSGHQKLTVLEPQKQRIVINKSAGQEAKKIKSNTVKIDNLAASTTEAQIRRMCQGIGSIESVQMGEGNATIVFKTQSAAMVFHKKYQRKMLDLSLIKVQLVPQSTPSKASTILLKSSTKD